MKYFDLPAKPVKRGKYFDLPAKPVKRGNISTYPAPLAIEGLRSRSRPRVDAWLR